MKNVPYLTLDDLKTVPEIQEEHTFYYLTRDKERVSLSCVKAQDYDNFPHEFQLEDNIRNEWKPQTSCAYLNLKVTICNPSILFGKNGLAYKNTRLGLGLEWKGENAKIKQFRKIGEIQCVNSQLSFEIKDIEVKQITSNIIFSYVVYVIEPGPAIPLIMSFGNKTGLVLGKKELLKIVCGGHSSEFPILFECKPNEPLWRVYFNSEDVLETFNCENLCILINKAHPSFEYLDVNSDSFNPGFLREVMESSVTALLLEIKHMDKSGYDLNEDEAVPSGSILQAIKYWNTHGISFKDNVNDIEFHRNVQLLMGGIKYDREN